MQALTVWALLALVAAPFGGPVASRRAPPCDAAETDPWVRELRDRTLRYNALARHAVEQHGPPISCDGDVTAEFDGRPFGHVSLDFAGGVSLRVATQPPEGSVLTLRNETGLGDDGYMRTLVAAYADGAGYRIDWNAPERSQDGDLRMETYWDPEPGFNASATFTYRGRALIEVRVGSAL